MSAETLNNRYARNSNNLAGKIYTTSINNSVWNKLIPKEEWTDGISDTQKALTVERNLPDNIDDWSDVTPNSGTNNCALAADVIPRGSTERSFALSQKAIESEMICVNDGRNAFEVQQQTKALFTNMRQVVSYTWKRRGQLEYFDVAQHKCVAANGLPESSTHMPTIGATSILTQKMLNKWYQYLIQNSAEIDGGSLGMQDGRPQFILITDAETSDTIMHEDATANAFLWNSKRVPELLQPLGVERGFRGFYHVIDNLPRRYTFAGGVWTEVMPYESAAATTGTKQILSPDYLAAPYTDSVIFLPSVMSFLHPKPISTLGASTQFNPQTYVGDFKWMNVINVDSTSPKYNPDGELGFYRAKLMSSTKPVAPQFGVVIRHLRCPSDIGAQACPESTDGNSSDLSTGESFFV